MKATVGLLAWVELSTRQPPGFEQEGRRMVLSEAARKAASRVTEKRREAARKNGAKGGRPRKPRPATGA